MRRQFSVAAGIVAILLGAASSGWAQTVDPQATSGTVGRIAKFVTATDLGNSLMFEKGNLIGIATSAPTSRLDIRAQNALQLWGVQPYLTFRDSNASNIRHRIRSFGGGVSLQGEDYINNSNPRGFVHVDRDGRVGFGTANPQRLIQIGPGFDPMFTIEASDASPRAGFIRFGDKTGWQLRIGRSRESSRGPLNTGLTGAIFTFRDDGAFGPTGYPLLDSGVEPLCRTLANFITRCEASSLRYKRDITPYLGGLDVVTRLRPIAFTRIYNGRSDIGFAAEEVAKIDPRLTYPNDEGKVEGVKYQLLTTALVNAIKEQEERLKRQEELIAELQSSVARLEEANRQMRSTQEPR
jgi:hypothetical protein